MRIEPQKLIETELKYYTDGGCLNNGKDNATGIIVGTDRSGNVIIESEITKEEKVYGIKFDRITNNVVEGLAILAVIKKLRKINDDMVISTDSQMISNLISLEWKASNPQVGVIVLRIVRHIHIADKDIKVIWEPRDKNKAGIYIEDKYKGEI